MPCDLSIVIPTFGREQVLLDTINDLVVLEEPGVELLIVDQTKQHGREVRQQLAAHDRAKRIRWIRQSGPGITPSMNCGAEAANGKFLLFLDDDIIPHQRLLAAHLKAQRENKGEIVAGRVLQPWHDDQHDSDPFTRTTGQHKQEFMGGNFSIRRDLLMELGGFDENFKGAAYHYEREFAERLLEAGYRIWYEPTALVRHLQHPSGGTRAKGGHLTSWNPRHPVGAYYYLFVSSRVKRRPIQALRRLGRSIFTRHHLRKPWYIPVTLTSELMGLGWALGLRIKGPLLPFPARGSTARPS